VNTSIRLEGLENLMRKLGTSFVPTIRGITRAIGEMVRNKVAVYPGPVAHSIRWASEKQRRAYFAQRRERNLPIGYTRQSDPMSQRLGPGWSVSGFGELGAKVAPRATYAQWVQGADTQQPMHRATGWVTDRQAVQAVVDSGDIQRVAGAAIRAVLEM